MAIQQKSPMDAHQMMKNEGVSYIDVRSAEEFQCGHAAGAINIPIFLRHNGQMMPNPDFARVVSATLLDKAQPLVVGCQAGKRSQMACEQLEKMGYQALYNVIDGYNGWSRAQLPIACTSS